MDSYFANEVDISSISTLLKHFGNDELEAILNDTTSSRIDGFIKDLPQVKLLESERERLIQENKRLAESNLSFESTYRLSRQELTKALEECQTVKNELDKKKSKLRELTRQNSLDTTLALMQAAMAEAEEASDEVANTFLAKDMPIDEFIKNFNEKRKVFHMRRIKVEKMPEEINKVQTSGAIHPTRPAPPPPTLPFSHMQVSGTNDANPPYPTTNPFASFISYQPPPSYDHY